MIIVKLNGGFCNNLFQYATARALSERNNDELKLDVEVFRAESLKDIYRLNYLKINEIFATTSEIEKLSNAYPKGILGRVIRKSKIPSVYNKQTHFIEKNNGFSFDKRIYELQGNVYLDGWFSDENYFKDIRDTILKEFELKNGIRDESKLILNKIINTNAVSIHIRRGEFVTDNFFGALPLEYYYRAVDYIKSKINKPHFYVFSDDIEWVRENLNIVGDSTIVSHNSSRVSIHHTQYDYEDLVLIKNCKHNIMALSTFSWWGAWLNQYPNKIVIAPLKAYNDKRAQKDYETGNFIPSNWIKL